MPISQVLLQVLMILTIVPDTNLPRIREAVEMDRGHFPFTLWIRLAPYSYERIHQLHPHPVPPI